MGQTLTSDNMWWQALFVNINWFIPALLGIISFIIYWVWYRVDPREPPGPVPLPLIGNYFSIDKDALEVTLKKWQKEYGDVYTAYLGSRKVVIVCGYENIRDILTKTQDAFLDRAEAFPIPFTTTKGVVMSNGLKWREARRFTLMSMKDMGLGHRHLHEKVVEEALILCSILENHPTKVLDLRPTISNSIANVISSVLFGQRFELDDPDFSYVIGLLHAVFAVGINKLVFFFPRIASMPFLRFLDPKRLRLVTNFRKFVLKQVEKHRESFDPTDPKDFVDLYLKVVQGDSDFDKSIFDEANMSQIIRDLFVAGTETTTTTLRWAILHLTVNPEMQDRCREQIHNVLGRDEIPALSHRNELPYVEAVIHEALRIGDIVPFSLLRTTTHDYEFHGHLIKKGTDIMPFLHSVHHDAKYWPEPDQFRPQRWLNEDGNLVRHEQLVPFSLGRRNCLGENVARTELFLFLTMLIQRFRFQVPPNCPRPTTEAISGATRMPHSYEVKVTRI